MPKKNILIISYSYPPSNAPAAQRPYALAKYLDKQLYNVTVLTCSNQDSSLGFDMNFNEEIEDVQLIKIKSINGEKARKLKQDSMIGNNNGGFKIKFKQSLLNFANSLIFPDRAVLWLIYVIPYFVKNRKKIDFDYIFSTSPAATNHLAAYILKKFYPNITWIADFRDFHYTENYSNQNGIKSFFHKLLERTIMQNASSVVFISAFMKKIYSEAYPNFKDRFEEVYNGFEENPFAENQQIDGEKLSIFYAGSFYNGIRSPKPLLFALESLINQNKIEQSKIAIQIAGNFENNLLEDIKDLKIFKSIEFLGLLSRNDVLKKYTQSHLLWSIVGNELNHYSGVPIKFFEYLASGRYIINFAPSESEPSSIIDKSGAGWNFENDINSEANKSKFLEIYQKFLNKELENFKCSNFISEFKKENQVNKLQKLL